MNAADVMTINVITVGPDATVRAVARTLLANRISAVPVVGIDCKLLGIVSEGDLMRRAEIDTGRAQPWWLAILAGRPGLATQYIKEHARRVSDLMTRDVVTATPETPLQEIVNLLEKHRIKRVPVVKDGHVVGIVSRADILQALTSCEPSAASTRDDLEIREDIVQRLNQESWTRPLLINVIVRDGAVELWGIVDTPTERKAIRVAAETAPGVRKVKDNLMLYPGNADY
jgi:CBS domain-containing protein